MKRRPLLAAGAALLATSAKGNAMTTEFDLQGHRGARGLWPENTLEGFARTLALGVSAVELDAAVTADGVVVVSHDPALNPDITRGRDGAWLAAPGPAISALTVAELGRYDVGRIRPGTRYASTYSAQTSIDGARIPTLVALFQLARRLGADGVGFNIETKVFPDRPEATVPPEAMAAAVVAAIEAEGMVARARVISFDWRTLAWVQRNAPHIAVGHITEAKTVRPQPDGSPSAWLAGHDPAAHGGSLARMVAAAGGSLWTPDHRTFDPAELATAHALGLRVIPWTVNGVARMRELIGLGVDGIVSDRPDLLRQVVGAMGLALPAPVPLPAGFEPAAGGR